MGSATASVYASGSGKYVNANMYWDSNSESTVEVTVEVSSNGSWRLVQRGNSSKVYLSHSYATDSYSNTFTATDGGEYIFQVYCTVEEQYYNDSFSTSGFTVDSSDDSGDSGGGDSGGGSSSATPCGYLIVNQGEGTILHVQRSWPPERTCYTDLQTGEPIYCDGEDCFFFKVEVLDGYELDYYDFEDKQLGYQLENFSYYTSDTSYDYYQIATYGNATVTTTATPIATAYIYEVSSGWDRYAPYIYDASSGWVRYVPYVHNGTSWERYS